jgi:UDP-N-acetyl-D-galactosamine dehydrogenase
MGTYVASQLVKAMASRSIKIVGAHVLIMGLTFKENCPDLRNSRVIDVIGELVGYNQKVDVFDPWVDPDEAERYCGIRPVVIPSNHHYDAVVIAVAHEEFRKIGAAGIRAYMKKQCVIYDLKYILPRDCVDLRL